MSKKEKGVIDAPKIKTRKPFYTVDDIVGENYYKEMGRKLAKGEMKMTPCLRSGKSMMGIKILMEAINYNGEK